MNKYLLIFLFLISCSSNSDTTQKNFQNLDFSNDLTFGQFKEKFVKIAKLNSSVSTNDVINTNNCKISICKSKYKDKAIILSSIDNLIKGGAGQAIQNMNILKNFDINEGLR